MGSILFLLTIIIMLNILYNLSFYVISNILTICYILFIFSRIMKTSIVVLLVLLGVVAHLTSVEGSWSLPWEILKNFFSPKNWEQTGVKFRKPKGGLEAEVVFNPSVREDKSKTIEERAKRPTPQWLADMEYRFLHHIKLED